MNSFRVSNFRLFDTEGAEISIKPITILTGANNSGKSSFVKAMVLFKNYLESMRLEFIKSGALIPTRHPLSFTLPELRMKGFSGAMRRDAIPGSVMSFTLAVQPRFSMTDNTFFVTYSFDNGRESFNELKDSGALCSIRVSCGEETVLLLETSSEKKDTMTIKEFNLGGVLLIEFVSFCLNFYLPYRLYDSAFSMDGGYYSDMVDDEGNFSWDFAARTDEGKRLAKMLDMESLNDIEPFMLYGYKKVVEGGDIRFDEIFKNDFFDAFEKALQENIVLYFPILEKIEGMDKSAVFDFLNGYQSRDLLSDSQKKNLVDIQRNLGSYLRPVMKDFEASDYKSFKDYYRSLENDALKNHFPLPISGIRHRGKENIIEDALTLGMNIAYDNIGFDERGDDSFRNAYKMLSIVQWLDDVLAGKKEDFAPQSAFIKRNLEPWFGSFSSRHILYSEFESFVKRLLYDFLVPEDMSRMSYFTDSFAYVRRFHSFEENTRFVQVVSDYLDRKSELLSIKEHNDMSNPGIPNVSYLPDTFIHKWIGKSGLNIGKELSIAREAEGLGFYLNIIHEDGTQESLADMGHGITQTISILLQIEAVIMENAINQAKNKMKFYKEALLPPAIIAIEEPEVSLHPCFQSLLADILLDATSYGQIKFIVETHSEYLVRKTQVLVSKFNKKEYEWNPFAVHYFKENGEVYELGYKETGKFIRPFGSGFFDESAKSMYQLLKREESEMNQNL